MNDRPDQRGDATWEDVQNLCRKLGLEPDSVVNIRLEAGRMVYVEVMYDLRQKER